MACLLRPKDCYIGQRVFWVMWIDQEQADLARENGTTYEGWYCYQPGLSPEIWGDCVERLSKNGHIWLRTAGKARLVYSCELHAVNAEYQWFCKFQLGCILSGGFPKVPIAEAVRVLTLLADLEHGCHAGKAAIDATEATYGAHP